LKKVLFVLFCSGRADPFQGAHSHRRIHLAADAVILTGVITDPGQDPWQGQGFFQDFVGPVQLLLCHVLCKTFNIHMKRAGRLTEWRLFLDTFFFKLHQPGLFHDISLYDDPLWPQKTRMAVSLLMGMGHPGSVKQLRFFQCRQHLFRGGRQAGDPDFAGVVNGIDDGCMGGCQGQFPHT